MTAAIFGLLGVIVGGMLNGLVAWELERRREIAEATAAARVLHGELGTILFEISFAQNDKKIGALAIDGHSTRAWGEHRMLLGRTIPDTDRWDVIDAAYSLFEAGNDLYAAWGADRVLTDGEASAIFDGKKARAKAARNALKPIACGEYPLTLMRKIGRAIRAAREPE